MFNRKRSSFTFKFILGVALAGLVLVPGVASAQATYGQCTDYVAKARSLTAYPAAYKWATTGYLAQKGYRQVATPQLGAIVVYQPGANGTDATNGHVAIVDAYVYGPDATGRIYFAIRGANQGQSNVIPFLPNFTEYGYYDVSVRQSSLARGQTNISFWVR